MIDSATRYLRPDENPEFILALSDLHLGAKVSRFEGLEMNLLLDEAMGRSRHVVLNGDIFELFYVKGEGKHRVRDAIASAVKRLTKWIQENPHTQFHYVLGNHENVTEFRNGLSRPDGSKELDGLNDLHKRFPDRFEWHPEAIMIGDMLFTHGDLLLEKNHGVTDASRRKYSLEQAEKHRFEGKLMEILEEPGAALIKGMRKPKNSIPEIYKELMTHAQNGTGKQESRTRYSLFHVRVDGESKLLDRALFDRVHHICTGHTHVQYVNEQYVDGVKPTGKIFHNTGGVTKGFDNEPWKLGFIAAQLGDDGKVHDVQQYSSFDVTSYDVPSQSGYNPDARWQGWVTRVGSGLGGKPEEEVHAK